jgi:hypothetical protein
MLPIRSLYVWRKRLNHSMTILIAFVKQCIRLMTSRGTCNSSGADERLNARTFRGPCVVRQAYDVPRAVNLVSRERKLSSTAARRSTLITAASAIQFTW